MSSFVLKQYINTVKKTEVYKTAQLFELRKGGCFTPSPPPSKGPVETEDFARYLLWLQVDDELEIKAYYAGHVLGAAMFQIKVGCESVVYTVSAGLRLDAC